jgi:hypothetical protein
VSAIALIARHLASVGSMAVEAFCDDNAGGMRPGVRRNHEKR